MTGNTVKRFGRIIWTGKGPAISKQIQAMARREELAAQPEPICSGGQWDGRAELKAIKL